MHLYEISTSGQSNLSVFADTYGQAVEIFMAWWLSNHQHDLLDLEVKQRNPLWAGLNTEHLHEALSRGVSGIGSYDISTGWSIRPPDDVMEEDA